MGRKKITVVILYTHVCYIYTHTHIYIIHKYTLCIFSGLKTDKRQNNYLLCNISVTLVFLTGEIPFLWWY